MGVFELRGKSLITVILVTSGLDFLLFGCKSSAFYRHTPFTDSLTQMIKVFLEASLAASASMTHLGDPIPP
jgi:hypothetical protein